jgi:hypothetical protein
LGYTPTTPTQLSDGLGTKINTGAAATDVNNNVTNISGGKIRTGLIQSNNFSGTGDGSGFATEGMSIDLTGGGISAKNFRITAAGGAFFKGDISGASGTFGGSIRIGSGESVFTADTNGIYLGNETFANAEFRVTPAGALTATSANITGTINATAGNFSGDINSTATITGGTIKVGVIGGGGTIINEVGFQDRIEDATLANSVSLGPGGIIFRGAHGVNNDNPTNYISLRVQENYARQITVCQVNNIEVMSVLGYPSSNQAAINVFNGGIQVRNYSFNDYTAGNGGRAIQCLGTLFVDGIGTFTGDVTANTSDRRLKTNIIPLTYGLADILKLNPVSYNWKDGTNGKQFGFIAQEVQEVMPDAVKDGEYLGLEKDAIYSALVNAIKEQQAQINDLKSQLNK